MVKCCGTHNSFVFLFPSLSLPKHNLNWWQKGPLRWTPHCCRERWWCSCWEHSQQHSTATTNQFQLLHILLVYSSFSSLWLNSSIQCVVLPSRVGPSLTFCFIYSYLHWFILSFCLFYMFFIFLIQKDIFNKNCLQLSLFEL